eukprot:363547-Chlamydomonas_euryale.AAC.13
MSVAILPAPSFVGGVPTAQPGCIAQFKTMRQAVFARPRPSDCPRAEQGRGPDIFSILAFFRGPHVLFEGTGRPPGVLIPAWQCVQPHCHAGMRAHRRCHTLDIL